MSRQFLAIDIRPDTVEAVLLSTGLKFSTLTECYSIPVAESSEDGDPLVEALKELKTKIDPGTANVVVAIPSDGVLYRKLTVPFKEDGKIRQVLPFELEPTLPIPIEELVIDFETVKGDGQQDIMAFAMHKTQLQRYIDLLESVNLRPVLITPGGYAAARLITGMAAKDDDFLFIDTGEDNHTVYAVCSGRVRMVRTVPISSLTEEILAGSK